MNKHFAGFLGAAAVLTMLAGCTAYDRTKDQFTQPVVKDVKKRHEPRPGWRRLPVNLHQKLP
ncbi:Osmotically inducible lipoprotein E [Klebsiella grimontii]|uniref:Osmotically inducible lipoprotein E n=1 Tax=Klebsiella grimontii TaxID=2058152 RepID=A0A7H4P5E1_9ENTR|nr:Osmotically inducible lipoprotein E [Klebsiella grimontii]